MAEDRLDREHILPGDATPLERAIADTDGRLDDVDMDLPRRVAGPAIAEVPARFLAHRAWGRSVDVWDPAWPEDVRRAVIEAAPAVHRHKGSPWAIATALAALRIDARIVQWWETVPRGTPYTFRITAYARTRLYDGEAILDPRLLAVAYATVMRTKPLSRAFDLAVGAGFVSRLGVTPVAVATSRHRAVVRARVPTEAGSTLRVAGLAVGRARHSALVVLQYRAAS